MSGTTRITIGVVAVIILIAIGGYWYLSKDADPVADVPQAAEQAETPEAVTTPSDEQYSQRLRGTSLEGSDAVVRDIVAALSKQPELVAWLANEDLVRRGVAAVHNVAEGVDPRAHLEFLKPEGAFKVLEDGDDLVVDPSSWSRYDLATDVFVSIDTAGAAQLLSELGPLIDEAHREIAPPGKPFRATLAAAFDRLLRVPVLDGTEVLDPKVVTYRYQDEAFESLSDAERQLLRMGPENVARIQAKLVELKSAFGL